MSHMGITKILINYAHHAFLYTYQWECIIWTINQLVPQVYIVYPSISSLQRGLSEFQLFIVFLQKFASQGLYMHDLYFSMIVAADIIIYTLFSGMLIFNCQTVVKSSKTEQILYKILVRLTNFITEGIFQILLCQSLYHFQYFLEMNSYFKATLILIFLISIYLLSLLQFYIGEASLTQFTSKYKRIHKSQLDYIKLIILNLQCFIFIFKGQLVAQSLLYFAFMITELSRIFITLNFINIHQIITKLVVVSLGFIICILNFGNYIEHQIVYCLTLAPLLSSILIHGFQYRIESILKSKFQELDQFELNFMLCYQELLIFNTVQKKTKIWSAVLTSQLRKQFGKEVYYIKNLCFINDNKELQTQQSHIQQYIILQTQYNHYKLVTQNIYLFTHFIYLHFAIGLQNETYKFMYHLSRFPRTNYLEKLKTEAFLIILKNKLQTSFLSKVRNCQQKSHELSMLVQQFIKDETLNNQMRNIIMTVIDRKIKILHFFQKSTDDNNLFSKIQGLIHDICQIEKKLEEYLEEFPSEKNLSILIFFLVEVKNDWSKAHELAINGIVNNSTGNEIFFNKQKNIIYIRFTFENHTLQIVNFSKYAPSFFGYLFQQFNEITDPNILIPGGIREIHNQFMLDFIESGQGLFFKNKGENLCQLRNGFIQTVQFFYDIQFEPNQLFKFLAFFSESEEQRALIIIDENDKIQGISKEFLKMINFPKTIYEEEIIDVLYDIPSSLLIEETCITEHKPNFKYRIQFPNTYIYMALKNMTPSQRIHSLKQKRHLSTFMALIDLRRNLGYKILRIVMVSEIECNLETIVELQDEQATVNLLNEDECVARPYNELYDIMYQIDIHQPLDTFRNNTEKSIRGEGMICKESNKESFNNNFSEQSINIYDMKQSKESKQISISSSAGGLQKSCFVRKYTFYEQMSNNKLLGSYTNVVNIFWVAYTLLLLCFIIVQMVMISVDFSTMEEYYEQVQVNNFFIQPQQKYQLTQFMWQDYVYLFNHNLINSTQLQYFAEFYKPLQQAGYAECKQNYENHFSDHIFQKFMQNQYVLIKQQTQFYQPIQFQTVNITLQAAFNELLDAIYKYHKILDAATNITFNRISPRSTYQYINYITFINEFNGIANSVYNEAIEEMEIVTTKWKLIPIPILILSVLIIFFSLIPIKKQLNTVEAIVNLVNLAENLAIESEIDRLQMLLNNLKSLSDLLFRYKFSILLKEKTLIESQSRSQTKSLSKTKTTSSKGRKILRIQVRKRFFIILLWYFIVLAVFVTQILSQIGLEYLGKFKNTFALFKLLSDIGVYIPAAYTQRDMIFYWTYFSYFNTTDRDQVIEQIQIAKNQFGIFLVTDFTQNTFSISDEFFQYFNNFLETNLCEQLNKTIYFDSDEFCSQSRSGILERGLRTTISDYKNQLDTELKTNFTQRTTPFAYELEAVYMSSNLISTLTDLMIRDIDSRISALQLILKVISIILFLYTLFQFLLIQIYLEPRMKKNLIYAKQISFLLPQETIFINDQYERELRRIAITESLI